MTRCMYDCVLSRTEDTMDVKNMFNLAKVLNNTDCFSENNFELSSFLMTLLTWQRFWITKNNSGQILDEIRDMTHFIYDYVLLSITVVVKIVFNLVKKKRSGPKQNQSRIGPGSKQTRIGKRTNQDQSRTRTGPNQDWNMTGSGPDQELTRTRSRPDLEQPGLKRIRSDQDQTRIRTRTWPGPDQVQTYLQQWGARNVHLLDLFHLYSR